MWVLNWFTCLPAEAAHTTEKSCRTSLSKLFFQSSPSSINNIRLNTIYLEGQQASSVIFRSGQVGAVVNTKEMQDFRKHRCSYLTFKGTFNSFWESAQKIWIRGWDLSSEIWDTLISSEVKGSKTSFREAHWQFWGTKVFVLPTVHTYAE